MIQLIPRLIGLMIGMTASIYSIVGAEKARSIAHSIANALSGPYGWGIILGAGAVAGVGIGLAAGIPSRQGGGPILRTGYYKLERGEVFRRGAGRGEVTIIITGNTITDETLPKLGSQLTRDLQARGVI